MALRPLIAAVLLFAAVGLGWVAYKTINPAASADQAKAPRIRVLVAAQSLPAGTLIKDSDLRERELGSAEAPEGAIVANEDSRAEIRGAMLRHYLDANAPLVRSDILRPRDRGFLAAVLTPGTRAVSIGVDAKTGASGLISPGDVVDVILAQEFQRGDTPVGRRVVAETVLRGIRVIAVDQKIAQGPSPPMPSPGGAAHVANTVTLQVTQEQAERVAVAQRLGQLVLTVRPIDASGGMQPGTTTNAPEAAAVGPVVTADPPGMALASSRPQDIAVFGSDVSAALSGEEPTASRRMRVIEGDRASEVVFR